MTSIIKYHEEYHIDTCCVVADLGHHVVMSVSDADGDGDAPGPGLLHHQPDHLQSLLSCQISCLTLKNI